MKRLLTWFLIIAFSLQGAPFAMAATGCGYPSSLDTFVDKIQGDFLTASEVNKFHCGVEKIEAELGTAPSGSFSTVADRFTDLDLIRTGKSTGQTITGGIFDTSGLSLKATSGNGAGTEFIKFLGGNDGATEWGSMRGGVLLWGTVQPAGTDFGDMAFGNGDGIQWVNAAGTTSANFGVFGDSNDDLNLGVPGTSDLVSLKWAGTSRGWFQELGLAGMGIVFSGESSTDHPAPAANGAVLYTKDNGAGKTQLIVRFATGAVQVIETEP